jgi:hypothetical protein
VHLQKMLEVMSTRVAGFLGPLYALLQDRYLSVAPNCAMILMDSAALSRISINFLSLSLDSLPFRSASNTDPVSRNFSVTIRSALR